MGHFSSLVFIMILVGAAGGIINYYTITAKRMADISLLVRFVMLGIFDFPGAFRAERLRQHIDR